MVNALPEWNLKDFYESPTDSKIKSDFSTIEKTAKGFEDFYKGKLATLTPEGLLEAIKTYEYLVEQLGKIGCYAQLLHSIRMSDPEIGKFYQSVREQGTLLSKHTLFFTLELNKVGDDTLTTWTESPELRHYKPWFRTLADYKPHQLDDKTEEQLMELNIVGRSAWVRLFDQTMTELKFPYEGKELNSSEILDLLSDKDPQIREKGARALGETLQKNIKLFTMITNTLAKDKSIEDNWRGYDKPISSRNLDNQVEDDVVEALHTSVQQAYPKLAHRYYVLKAKWLKKDRLEYWDRNAPLPGADDKKISWETAKQTVLDAYESFSPTLADLAKPFFEKGWIDAPVRDGKVSGAFSHPTVPSVHPYVLLNYQGKTRDVMTLAHELGHGVHQVLAAKQGVLLADTPLTLAETASVFGEMLTFQSLVEQETDTQAKRRLIAGKVEDMLNTVVRQIAFCTFEKRVHDARKKGELTADELGAFWQETQEEALGQGVRFDPICRTYWAYIPHFIHTPFYVYAYAFGDCLVNSLYATYKKSPDGFAEKYLDMLRAGGTKRHKDLLAPFGLNAGDPAFWNQGLGFISSMIDTLEDLD